jgi:hypothetical protein
VASCPQADAEALLQRQCAGAATAVARAKRYHSELSGSQLTWTERLKRVSAHEEAQPRKSRREWRLGLRASGPTRTRDPVAHRLAIVARRVAAWRGASLPPLPPQGADGLVRLGGSGLGRLLRLRGALGDTNLLISA